ncbi:unnamed protein product [Kluyveromyces dobzhanskii CBS 2104]|uniref:WGS project CCBQ000000000 data, contig 00015 n=1 Tax=Kluyveromyces dobzhanskii CBS 2104 TaxID=1427455 RepID=A0A0A8LAZ2_9SACH|nr:unnamed protein product [Kluyveromyces dobzhanskii CBS 2104]
MPSKRSEPVDDPPLSKRSKDAPTSGELQYPGYKIPKDGLKLDTIRIPTTSEEKRYFFENYVSARKPCKFTEASGSFNWDLLRPNRIKKTLGNEVLQIEKKSDGGFGSGSKRVSMKFHDFINELLNGNKDLYLTTQYAEHDIEGQQTEDEDGTFSENEDYEEEHSTDEGETAFPENVSEAGSMDSINFDDLHDDFEDMNDDENDLEGEESNYLEDNISTVKELYQPPLDTLISDIPEQLDFLKLVPQQINLWVGSASEKDDNQSFLLDFDPKDNKLGLGRNVPGGGSSSGLHHDHADNIYIPVNGHKRFTLFGPSDVDKMYTVGNVDELYDTGIINYIRDEMAPKWSKLRPDGAIQTQYLQYVLDKHDLPEEAKKSYRKLLNCELQKENVSCSDDNAILDPPSFSKIPPTVVHLDKVHDKDLRQSIESIAREKWPKFFSAHRVSVDLKPGEMLYLPTGWFHEVTSFGSNDNNKQGQDIHVAVNYWLMPPTGGSVDQMYIDDYWNHYFKGVSNALRQVRETE